MRRRRRPVSEVDRLMAEAAALIWELTAGIDEVSSVLTETPHPDPRHVSHG